MNSALVSAQQAATMQSPGGLPGASGSSKSSNKISKHKNKRSKYVRLKNIIDRSTGQTSEVTVNNVTICITEYKAKTNNRDSHSRHDSSDYSESNDSLRS